MKKPIHRLDEYLASKGISKGNFEKDIGFSNGYINTTLKRNSDIGSSNVEKILNNCPDLNPDWFLKGIGDMILNREAENLKDCNNCIYKKMIDRYEREIERYERELNRQEKEIERLNKTIDQLKSDTDPKGKALSA